ncbi:MAG: hypothetical protein ACREE6_06395 [Limisphaerales bacterium]
MIQTRHFPRKPLYFTDLFEEYGSGSIARLPMHQNGGFEVHYIAKGYVQWERGPRLFSGAGVSLFHLSLERHGSCVDFKPGHLFHCVVYRLKESGRGEATAPHSAKGFGLSDSEQADIFRRRSTAGNRCFSAGPDLA